MNDVATNDLGPRELHLPAATAVGAKQTRSVPGQRDMWAFVLFEAFLFTAYLTVYMLYRIRDPDLYLRAQTHLDIRHGALNTVILLISSWSIARCVQAAREQAFQAALKSAFVTLLFGVVFMSSKIFEWTTKIEHGFEFSTNQFFTFYFFITGIHFIHLLIGFVALGVLIYELRDSARRSQEIIETCAIYWHTIDFLWVIIFSLLYVVR
jgi:nitric oxide reductase NorE protein